MELIANTKPLPASMRSALLDESANCDRLLASPRGNDANIGKTLSRVPHQLQKAVSFPFRGKRLVIYWLHLLLWVLFPGYFLKFGLSFCVTCSWNVI